MAFFEGEGWFEERIPDPQRQKKMSRLYLEIPQPSFLKGIRRIGRVEIWTSANWTTPFGHRTFWTSGICHKWLGLGLDFWLGLTGRTGD